MAVPAYTTDLTDIFLDTGAFSTLGGGRVTEDETDDFFQGISCWSHDPFSSGTEGGAYNSAQTITAGDAALIWTKCDVAATLATKTLGGIQAVIGSSASDYKRWYVDGSDTYAAGGWKCMAIDPTVTQSATTGTPTATTSYFGMQWYVPATGASKGYPMKIDAMRQGRGEILINGGQSGSLATFAGIATENDLQANKWGLFEAVEGGAAGYRWKGLMSFGPTTLTEFTDANINISIENTEYVTAGFNRIEFNNTSSVINWTNISIIAIGTVSKGQFEMIDNCTFNDTSGVFTGMDTFIYLSNATITTKTFRGCGLVTQGSASFTSCLFDEPSGTIGLSSNVLGSIDKCTFNSDGTGYGVDIGNITTTQSLDWKNHETGYVTGTAGTNVGVTPTGNETILCNVSTGEVLTINVTTGSSTPSVANSGSGTVNVVSSFTLTLTNIPEDTQVTIVNSSTRVELQNSLAPASGIVTYSHGGGETVDILLMSLEIDPNVSDQFDLLLPSADSSIKFQTLLDPNFSNPA